MRVRILRNIDDYNWGINWITVVRQDCGPLLSSMYRMYNCFKVDYKRK